MSTYHLGENRCQRYARFETKSGHGSGAGYERWRSFEYRTHTPGDEKEDVYVAHHRLLAIVACYPADKPLEAILEDLDGKDVHHKNGIKWDNRPENIEPVEHARHSSITQSQVRAWAEDDKRQRDRARAGLVDEDICAGCGDSADTLATSAGFDGQRCIECARVAADGEPIEL